MRLDSHSPGGLQMQGIRDGPVCVLPSRKMPPGRHTFTSVPRGHALQLWCPTENSHDAVLASWGATQGNRDLCSTVWTKPSSKYRNLTSPFLLQQNLALRERGRACCLDTGRLRVRGEWGNGNVASSVRSVPCHGAHHRRANSCPASPSPCL